MARLAKLGLLSALLVGATVTAGLVGGTEIESTSYAQSCKADGETALGSYECCSRKTKRVNGSWVCCSDDSDECK